MKPSRASEYRGQHEQIRMGSTCRDARLPELSEHPTQRLSSFRYPHAITDIEIATLTEHSLKDTHAILDAHYLNRVCRELRFLGSDRYCLSY
jgi:hypothetical protein